MLNMLQKLAKHFISTCTDVTHKLLAYGCHGFSCFSWFFIVDPTFTSKDGNTRCDTETQDDRPCDTEGNTIESGRLQDREDDTNIMGITVHGTDCLVPDVRLVHPLIQLHVVDMETRNYMKKSDKYRQ